MKTPLLKDQIEDVEKIANAIDLPNFSKPGAGKTYTTIGAIERLGFQSGVVVCPPSATIMWKETLEHELGAKVQWLKSRYDMVDRTADVYVLTYHVLNAHLPALFTHTYDFLVGDESHKLKSPDASRTEAFFGKNTDGAGGLYETARQCWLLTGTPMERYADDLWAQLRATQPDTLARYNVLDLYRFQRTFCVMQEKQHGKMVRPQWKSVRNINETFLNKMLYDEIGIIRRDVSSELPPVRFREVYVHCPLTGDLRKWCADKTLEQIEELLLGGGDDGGFVKARRLTGLGKLKDSLEYIEEVANRQPVLVGYWHTDVGKEYMTRTKKRFSTARIGGDVSASKRETIRKAFNRGEIDILYGQIGSMSESMNLQEYGSYVIIAEDDWSASKIEQFYKRISRRGQKNETQVDFLRSDIPVDIALRKVRERKAEGSKLVLSN